MSVELRIGSVLAPTAVTQPTTRAPQPQPQAAVDRDRFATNLRGVPDGSSVSLDPATGRVVFEYFDATGALTNSTPSRQQLDAYRLATLSGEVGRGQE